jgi:hypothetical protein
MENSLQNETAPPISGETLLIVYNIIALSTESKAFFKIFSGKSELPNLK